MAPRRKAKALSADFSSEADATSSPDRTYPARKPPAKKQKTISELFNASQASNPRVKATAGTSRKKQSPVKVGKRKKVEVVELSSDASETQEEIEDSDEGGFGGENGQDDDGEAIKAASSSSPRRPSAARPPAQPSPKRPSDRRASPLSSAQSTARSGTDNQLWCDKHYPSHPCVLAVHDKKILQVRTWLSEALFGPPQVKKYRKLLVLSGPAGSGKTAVIKALANVRKATRTERDEGNKMKGKAKAKQDEEPVEGLGYEILEWTQAGGAETSDGSHITLFQTWLARASAGPTLLFASTASTSKSVAAPSNIPKVIVIEDLPTLSHLGTRESFIASLASYISSALVTSPPVVLIISDSTVRPGAEGFESALSSNFVGGGNSERSLSAWSILPSEILDHPKVSQIKFNPVSVTIMKRLLGRICDLEWPTTGTGAKTKAKPGPKDLEEVLASAAGDLRSALNGLQFLSLHGKVDTASSKGGKKPLKAKSHVDADGVQSSATGRETSLAMFHSIGKILWNKRWGQDPEGDRKDKRAKAPPTSKLPKHLKQWNRLPLKTDVDGLFSDTTVSTDTFMGYLHHNYPQYCEEPEEAAVSMEYFSQADALMCFESSRWTAKPLTSLYSFHVAARGMLIGLPSPVPRRGQRPYKPETWELVKRTEAADVAIDAFKLAVWGGMMMQARKGDVSEEMLDSVIRLPRKILATELIPYLGVIGKSRAIDYRHLAIDLLSSFPPLAATVDQHMTTLLDEDEEAGSDAELRAPDVPPLVVTVETKTPMVDAEVMMEDEDDPIVDDDDW